MAEWIPAPTIRARWVTLAFVAAAAILGLSDAWTQRFDVNSDALSYLEISEAMRQGDWRNALNTHWSPLYPLVLAIGHALANPAPPQESTVAHLVTYCLYLATIAAFWLLVRELVRTLRQATAAAETAEPPIPEIALVSIAWVLFIWSSREFIGVGTLSPDMTVAAVLFLFAAILLRLRRADSSWGTFAALGITLGAAYLVRTVMLPQGCLVLGAAAVAVMGRKGAAAKLGLAAGLFLLISAPLIVALSLHSGRVMIGSSGPWNYARFANGIGTAVHWQGEPAAAGTPRHPTRQLLERPTAYEFATPVPGAYPPMRDPMYWYEGIEPHFDPAGTARTVRNSAWLYAQVLLGIPGSGHRVLPPVLAIGLVVLIYARGNIRGAARDLAAQWPLLVPAIAGLAIYSLVYAEPRYLGAHFALVLIGCFAAVRLPGSAEMRRVAEGLALVVVVTWAASTAYRLPSVAPALGSVVLGRDDGRRNEPSEIAAALKARGLDGLPTAYVGNSFRFYWARMAGSRVVAEIKDLSPARSPYVRWINQANAGPPDDLDDVEFFWSDAGARAMAQEAFRATGAQVIVAEAPTDGALPEGWDSLGDTGLVAQSLAPTPGSTPSRSTPARSR